MGNAVKHHAQSMEYILQSESCGKAWKVDIISYDEALYLRILYIPDYIDIIGVHISLTQIDQSEPCIFVICKCDLTGFMEM